MSDEYPLGPGLDFLRRLWELNHALERLSGSMERRLGITAQQRLALRCVGKYPGISPGALAAVLSVDPGTVSATLRRLERKGLLQRRRDPRDARRVSLGLTEAGRALDRPMPNTVEDAVEKLLASTSAADLGVMAEVVVHLTELLGAEILDDQRPRAARASLARASRGGRGMRGSSSSQRSAR